MKSTNSIKAYKSLFGTRQHDCHLQRSTFVFLCFPFGISERAYMHMTAAVYILFSFRPFFFFGFRNAQYARILIPTHSTSYTWGEPWKFQEIIRRGHIKDIRKKPISTAPLLQRECNTLQAHGAIQRQGKRVGSFLFFPCACMQN